MKTYVPVAVLMVTVVAGAVALALPRQVVAPAGQGASPAPTPPKVETLANGTKTTKPELLMWKGDAWRKQCPLLLADKVTWPADEKLTATLELKRAQFESLHRYLKLQIQVLELGSWDVAFLNATLDSTLKFAKLAREVYPDANTKVTWIKECLVLHCWVYRIVDQRVNVAKNLRINELHLTEAKRLEMEILLLETESELRK